MTKKIFIVYIKPNVPYTVWDFREKKHQEVVKMWSPKINK